MEVLEEFAEEEISIHIGGLETKGFLTKPLLVPVELSVRRYEEYLKVAGNENVNIKIFSLADQGIFVGKQFAPGYVECIGEFLESMERIKV